MTAAGTIGWQGFGNTRAFEWPDGGEAPVSPEGRASIRFNLDASRFEQSIDEGPWTPLTGGGGTTLQDAYDASGASQPKIALAAAGGPLSVADAAVPVGDLFSVGDNAGTVEYLRVDPFGAEVDGDLVVSGQINGGALAGDELELAGNSTASLGLIRAQAPIEFDDVTPANALSPYSIRDASTATLTAPFIGGTFADQRSITFSNALFVYEVLRGAPVITSDVTPSFAAFTLFNALPQLRAGPAAGENPLQLLTLNVGGQTFTNVAGARTSPTVAGVNMAHTLQSALAGATLTVTNYHAVSLGPTFSTVAGSTVDFGTIRGLWARNPAPALFAPGAGTELMTAYRAVDVDAVPFGGNVEKAALRSALTPASNTRMLNNIGGADSDFAAGDAHFNDGAGIAYGNTVAAPDVLCNYNGSALEWDFAVGGGSDLRLSNPSGNRFVWDTPGGVTTGEYTFSCLKFAFGTTAAVGNQKGQFVANAETVTVGGEFNQFLLTQSGNDTLDAAISTYAGWRINGPTPTVGTGSVTSVVGLDVTGSLATVGATNRIGVRIQSNPSGAPGINAALYVAAGRSRFDGIVDINNGVALGGGLVATLGTIGGAGPTSPVQIEWVQIEVGGSLRWLAAWA